jgi:hypothetical protein
MKNFILLITCWSLSPLLPLVVASTPVGIWYGTQVASPTILSGTNQIMVFQPKYGEQFSVPVPVASYKSNNPDTEVYATIGDGDSGITKEKLSTLMAGDLQPNLDGLILEMEKIGSGNDRGGWTSDADIVADLNSLRTHFTTIGKKLSVTTGGSGFTAELACSLPSWTGACPAQLHPDQTQNLTTFLGDISEIAWDIWTPQIYDASMKVTWSSWQETGYDAWSNINPSVQIVPSVPQPPGATIASMQQVLATWLTESKEFSDLKSTLPIVGYPYNSAYEVPAVPEPTTLLLALLAMTAVPLRVRCG